MNKKIWAYLLIGLALFIVIYQIKKYYWAPEIKIEEYKVYDLSGKRFIINPQLKKNLLISFFATWCGPCNLELKKINKLKSEGKLNDWEIIAISDESPETLIEFIKNTEITQVTFLTPEVKLSQWNIFTYPTNYWYENGKLKEKKTGIFTPTNTN